MEAERLYMSRRREAQDLARALALSTQEARAAAELPPHTLSSKTTTQDSREMELKAVLDPRLELSSRDATSGSGSGPSAIDSFTPQLAVRPSSILGSSSNSFPTPAQHSRSSPILRIPSSRLSTTEKSRSSGSSSHRPLFSPTQTSKHRPAPGPTPRTRTPHREVSSNRAEMTQQKANRRIVLSSSPPEAVHLGKHPSSDHEAQEEVEERPISRPPSIQPTKAVGQSRTGAKPFPMSPPSKRRASPDPLEANLSGPISPTTVLVDESIGPFDPPRMRAQSSVPVESQVSMAESASTRRSSRVVENNAKKEREREERRAKRRAEKESKARKETEAKKREEEKAGRGKGSQSPMRRSTRLEVEVTLDDRRRSTRTAPESIVVLDHPPPKPRRDTASTPHLPGSTSAVEPPAQPQRPSKRARNLNDNPVGRETTDDEGKPTPGSVAAEAAPPVRVPAKKAKKKPKAAKKSVKEVQSDTLEEQTAKVLNSEGAQARGETTMPEEFTGDDEAESEPGNGAGVTIGEAETRQAAEEAEPKAREDVEKVEVDEEEPIIAPASALRIRSPLRTHASNMRSVPVESSSRTSPGPSSSGIKWKTSRNDLNSVLSKFPGARQTGISRKLKIAPLHMKIGPPVKALPPPPPKPSKKKKVESDDDDDDEEAEMESDGEGGTRKKPKVKGIEWFMEED